MLRDPENFLFAVKTHTWQREQIKITERKALSEELKMEE